MPAGKTCVKLESAKQNWKAAVKQTLEYVQPPPPPDGQGRPAAGGMSFATDIYAKMADELGLSADDLASAMEQAQRELLDQ